jgi:DNA-binding beta-propeller fold protein YncE
VAQWLGLLLVASAGALLAWWLLMPRAEPEPAPPWAATALVLAGDGVDGWRDGPAALARFSDPFGVAVAADGTVYVADAGDAQRLRAISPAGVVSTVAGGAAGFTDGPGSAARFSTPSGLAIGVDGTVYVADTGNHAIRRVSPEGVVTTLAGDGVPGHRDGAGAQARFNGPLGVAVHPDGRVLVADTYNDRIRVIAPDGAVSTLAGDTSPGLLDGPAAEARFDTPSGVAVDLLGHVLVADTGNDVIRAIDPAGVVSTRTGPFEAGLGRPIGLAVSAAGEIYITDERGRIVEVAADGSARVLAGSSAGFRDGTGHEARFRRPAGVAVAGPEHLVVADAGNALIRVLAAPAWHRLRPPASPWLAPRFDPTRFGHLPLLWPVAPLDGPHEVAGTHGEARGGEGAERFHVGIDVRHEHGTPARAVRTGVVTSPLSTGAFGSLNEWLRVGPITYVHIRVGRTRGNAVLDTARFVPTWDERGQLTRIRVRRGARFRTGEAVGSVNAFNHVHMSVGWPGEEYNPLRFGLVQFEDTIPPTIERNGIHLHDEDWQPLTTREQGRVVVSGRVRIVVDAWDQAEGNRPGRRLGLYRLGYQILHRDGTPAPGFETPRRTLEFDRLPSGSAGARLVYAAGSGIPFYGQRRTRFLYIVTNHLRDGVATEDWWDTTHLPPGDYVVRILAADFHGNTAAHNTDVPVRVRPAVEAPSEPFQTQSDRPPLQLDRQPL